MSSYEFHPADYNRIIIRQLRFILVVFSIITIIGYLVVRKLPKQYVATAVVQANLESFFDGAKIDPFILNSMVDNIGSMMIDITGYEVLLKTGQKLGTIPESVSVETVMQNQNALTAIEKMRGMISLNPIPANRQIAIKVTSKNAEETYILANCVSEIYRAYAFNNKVAHLKKKEQRIHENLDKCKDELLETSDRMIAVRTVSPGLLDEEYFDKNRKKTDLLNQKLQYKVHLKLSIAFQIKQYSEIAQQLESYLNTDFTENQQQQEKMFDYLSESGWISELFVFDPALKRIHKRVIELNDSRNQYLQCFKSSHPALVAIDRQLHKDLTTLLDGLEKINKSFLRDSINISETTDSIYARLRTQPQGENLYGKIQSTYTIQEQMCETIEAELSEIQTAIKGMVPYVISVADAAKPGSPDGMSAKKLMIIIMIGGGILGLLIAVFREMADRSIQTIEDIHRVIPEYKILAVVPELEVKKSFIFHFKNYNQSKKSDREYKSKLPVLFNSSSQCGEAFRMLGAQLRVQNTQQNCSVIMVTSSVTSEGKTITASNVSIALAHQGYQTLLIEANFRRPVLGSLFGIPPLPGLSHLLLESAEIRDTTLTVTDIILGDYNMDVISNSTGLRNFHLLLYGSHLPNPVELLGSDRMASIIDQLRIDYDYIIIDTPPVIFTTDAQILSRYCNGIVIVYRSGGASRDLLLTSIATLEKTGTPVLGICCNKWEHSEYS